MNAPVAVDVEAALAVAQQWLDTVDGVISVGEGDLDGVSTVAYGSPGPKGSSSL